jgi:hypothetical protein
LLGLLAVLAAVWVSSATLPPPAPAPVPAQPAKGTRAARPAVRSASRDVTSFDLNEAAERLRSRIGAAPRPRTPERNPFEFAPAPAPRVAAVSLPLAAPAPVVPVGPVPPPFTLSGVAEHQKENGVERTAILIGINGDARIYYAKAGDRLLGRYEVTAVGADAIELRETESGQLVRLGLR